MIGPPGSTPKRPLIGRPSATARRLVEASVSPNTRRAYAGALRRLDAWLDGRELHDVTLAAYLAELHDGGRRGVLPRKLAGQPAPAGERTARVLAGYRRTAGDRGRGQARPFGVSDLAAVLATCHRPRRRGRGVESEEVALERGRLDTVIAGLLFIDQRQLLLPVAEATNRPIPGTRGAGHTARFLAKDGLVTGAQVRRFRERSGWQAGRWRRPPRRRG